LWPGHLTPHLELFLEAGSTAPDIKLLDDVQKTDLFIELKYNALFCNFNILL